VAVIKRLTDSTLLVTTDDAVTLFDPGIHTFTSGAIDLNGIGEVTRVLITHEHLDHVSPSFVTWLIDRRPGLVVHANQAVADLLSPHGIEVDTLAPHGVGFEDALHEPIADGSYPTNRAFTIEGVITHPGDSRQLNTSGPVLALPTIVPWASVRSGIEMAIDLQPELVIPIHDFYLNEEWRSLGQNMITPVLAEEGIEVVGLGWGKTLKV